MKYKIVIPARANSKRLPKKNMRILGNKPLIEYSIDFAMKYFPAEDIWVNSDDQKVIEFSLKKGVRTTTRPKELASDFTTTVDVLKHQLNVYKSEKISCEAVILLQPTNPFREEIILNDVLKKFETTGRNSLATFSIFKHKTGKIENMNYKPLNYKPGQRSQDLKKEYFENGLLYITKAESIFKNEIITEDVYPLVCNKIKSTVDIDYIEDFYFAESLLKH